ncbi:MAG TPA: class I SAM-dependent methyltransferase [Candidatus Didemnitutus sp.]|nr:class I SAM-dependent methyltransferase [Candidatus Didemnitutus sp.]
MSSPQPEFDRYAPNYGAGFDDPLKVAIGADARAFLQPKFNWLQRVTQSRAGAPLDYLDFGCGTADFLALVTESNLPWRYEGCDISGGMLDEARRRWPKLAERAKLWQIDAADFPTRRYDVITAICVFHHIPPAEWNAACARLCRALRPGGMLCIFEHNPWNPVTSWMVSRTAIDADAHLLSPRITRNLMIDAGFSGVQTSHFLFVPPRWVGADAADRMFQWFPLGGQYLVRGYAPAESGCSALPAAVT